MPLEDVVDHFSERVVELVLPTGHFTLFLCHHEVSRGITFNRPGACSISAPEICPLMPFARRAREDILPLVDDYIKRDALGVVLPFAHSLLRSLLGSLGEVEGRASSVRATKSGDNTP
eukprot:gene11559-biopygen3192